MEIKIKYKIGDKLYFINPIYNYGELYSVSGSFRVYSIETLNSKSGYNTVKYFDIHDDKGHLEEDCFLSKEDAWKECDRRNMKK